MNSLLNLNKYIPYDLSEAIEFDRSYFNIPLVDNKEELVDFEKIVKEQGIKVMFNDDLVSGGSRKLFLVRVGLVQPLISAIYDFKELGYYVRFEYLYRRLEDQKASFERSVKTFLKKYPDLDKEDILEIAGIFVASTPDSAGHLSGAAIDLTLLDSNLTPIDMGVPYIHPGIESKTFHDGISKTAKANRKILYDVMTNNGFANYPYEFWHFSMGDKIAARIKNKKIAIYGPLRYDPNLKKAVVIENSNVPFSVEHLFN